MREKYSRRDVKVTSAIERQSNVHSCTRGMFDHHDSVFSSFRKVLCQFGPFVVFRLVFYGSIMATSSPAEERQLFLMENTNRRLDSILESQKKLKEANAAVQQDNVTRKTGATK